MPFADEMIGVGVAEDLGRLIGQAAPGCAVQQLSAAAGALHGLSVSRRAEVLRDALLADVGEDYPRLAAVVRRALQDSAEFRGWLIWPVTSAVATAAVRADTPGAFIDALTLLAELTGRLTSEFAVRTLLRHDCDRALAVVLDWTASPDEHVRRLASEGTRPYLPWAVRVPELAARPGSTVPILNALYRDDSEYVRRSVANHLNDLSRDHPELVVHTAARWLADAAPTTPALVRRALRTLVKRGHPEALALLGFPPATIDLDGPRVTDPRVPWGGAIRFTAAIRNVGPEPVRLTVDYVIHHRKANGSLSPKVFKLATCELAAGERFDIARTHSFRMITTRRYYAGRHAVSLQVNGVASEPEPFELLADPGDDRLGG
jgi:3-methyladenine DNA glycosylase AlkC